MSIPSKPFDILDDAVIPPATTPHSFPQAVALSAVPGKENTYAADLKNDWVIGQVPHGGYLASLLTTATAHHFETTPSLKPLAQPDLITAHFEFLARSVVGPCQVLITPLKLGRQYSTSRAQLLQYPHSDSRKPPEVKVEALITQGNLQRETASGGLSLETRPAIPRAEIPDRDTCVEFHDPPVYAAFRPAVSKVRYFLPPGADKVLWKTAELGPSVREQWVCWNTDTAPREADAGHMPASVFGIQALPFLVDEMRPLTEAYDITGNWFPTLSYGLEVKRAPPPSTEGWEWLYMRLEMRQAQHGRFDLDVLVLDEHRQLVAISRHTALIVGVERNFKQKGGSNDGSKL